MKEESNVEFTLSIPILPEEEHASSYVDSGEKHSVQAASSDLNNAVNAAVKVILREIDKLRQTLMVQIARISRENSKLSSRVAGISGDIKKLNGNFARIMEIAGDINGRILETHQITESLKYLDNEVKTIIEENTKLTKTINELRENLAAKQFKHLEELGSVGAYRELQILLKASIEQLNELRRHIGEVSTTLRELIKTLRSEHVLKDIRNINITVRELAWHMEELKSGIKQSYR